MNENMLKSWNENSQALLNPFVQFNKVAVENMAKMAELQFSSAKYFADLSFNQLRSAISIEDADGARKFANQSLELANEINKKLMEDSKKLAELGSEFKGDIESLYNKDTDSK